jgi:hypothetical protein
MSEKVVLPKFRLPGRRPHWMVMVLWGVGALVVVQVAVLAALALQRHPDEAAAAPAATTTAPAAAAAHATASTPAPAPAVASTAAAPTTAPGSRVLTGGMPAPTAPLADGAVARRPVHHRSHHEHGHGAPARTLAKAGRPEAPSKPDALDELLKKFK